MRTALSALMYRAICLPHMGLHVPSQRTLLEWARGSQPGRSTDRLGDYLEASRPHSSPEWIRYNDQPVYLRQRLPCAFATHLGQLLSQLDYTHRCHLER